MSDSLKAVGTSMGTLAVNFWQLVPEALGVVLIILNIIYVALKIKKEY
jgi:hypothetical protein|tara:strand:+ start:1291 stop:1434 length:144 start_codon:yes stop_codon:yes gene_type:complete